MTKFSAVDTIYISSFIGGSIMNWQDRRIAFTDIETTGLEPFWFPDNYGQHPKLFARHEICEIGLVVASQPDLEIISTGNIKIKI